MVNGMNSVGRLPRPVRDCSGWLVKSRGGSCSVAGTEGKADEGDIEIPFETVTPANLDLLNLPGANRLAWLTTGRFSNGEMIGPVALVELAPGAMIVKSTGTLRAFGFRRKLRIESLGDGQVLLAEGDACDGGSEACDHGIRLAPLRRDRFADGPLENDSQGCGGSSMILVRSHGHVDGPSGGDYKFESAVTFSPTEIAIHEQLSVETSKNKQDGVEGFVSRVQGDRTIQNRYGHLVTSGPSLLEQWMNKTR